MRRWGCSRQEIHAQLQGARREHELELGCRRVLGREQEVSGNSEQQILEDTAPSHLPAHSRCVPRCPVSLQCPQQCPFGTERGLCRLGAVFVRQAPMQSVSAGLSHGQTCSSSCWQQTTFILCHTSTACVGFFCSHESQVSLQDFAVTDARARSEARLKLLSVILFLELGYQGWGEQALPFCHPWFAWVCLV